MRGELVPLLDRRFPAARELPDSLMETLAKGGHAEFDTSTAKIEKWTGILWLLRKVKQGRHQLPPGQVARSAEDDEYVWRQLVVGFHSDPCLQSV